MLSDRELAREVLQRSKTIIRQRKTRRQMAFLTLASAVCLVLIVAVALGMPESIAQLPQRRAVSDTLGALFVHNSALGYVVVGVLAFILGAAVTLLAFLSKKLSKPGRGDERD